MVVSSRRREFWRVVVAAVVVELMVDWRGVLDVGYLARLAAWAFLFVLAIVVCGVIFEAISDE